ncbi:MAG: T9SS type A sorting domain-containing protein, partial [Bacteroidia bacterium]|nr:T9SS type A sorting domain-containing protein [Bacteroidia bacterium]
AVLNPKNASINISDYTTGVYFLRIYNARLLKAQKFIVVKQE